MVELADLDLSRVISDRAAQEPHRLAVVFESETGTATSLTVGDLDRRHRRCAAALAAAQIGPGDHVAVQLRNEPAFVDIILALMRLGAILVPVDPRARGPKLRYFLTKGRCTAAVVSDIVDAEASLELDDAGIPRWIVGTEAGRARGIGIADPARSLDAIVADRTDPDMGHAVVSADQPWSVAFTSGTTGDPKGIIVPYRRLGLYRALSASFGYRSDDVTYTGLSLTHGNAQVVTLFPALWGFIDHAVLSPWFTRARLWDICRAHGVTTWSNLGGLAAGVYSQPTRPDDLVHDVRLVVSAGMPADLWTAFEARFGVDVLEWYGSMEGGFACNPVGQGPVGSFGRAADGLVELDVHDDHGHRVPDGEIGELVARPSTGAATLTYLDDPEASAAKIRDGWLRTGDLVTRDPQGWYYFRQRAAETGLRRLGEFISEGFIQRAIGELDDVSDVATYGIPAPSGAPGEIELVVAVVPDGPAVDIDRLVAHARATLEPSHVPDLVQVVPELPSTPSGKVLIRLLAVQLTGLDARVRRVPRLEGRT